MPALSAPVITHRGLSNEKAKTMSNHRIDRLIGPDRSDTVADVMAPEAGVGTPLYDATITSTGILPRDSTIDEPAGPANMPWPRSRGSS
jgi:hypothetical protein